MRRHKLPISKPTNGIKEKSIFEKKALGR